MKYEKKKIQITENTYNSWLYNLNNDYYKGKKNNLYLTII